MLQIIGAIIGYTYWILLFFRVENILDDLGIYSGLNICECTLSRYEVGFKERATACIFPSALNRNICVCSLVPCTSRKMKRLLGVVWQGLARPHFSVLTSLVQRYLHVQGFKCKLSIKSNVLVLSEKFSSGSGSSQATSDGRLGIYSEKIPLFIIFLYSANFSLGIHFWPHIRNEILHQMDLGLTFVAIFIFLGLCSTNCYPL